MFTIQRSQLLSALNSAFGMTSSKTSPKDITKNVLLRTARDGVTFHANDTEAGITFFSPVDSIDAAPGTQVLLSSRVLDLVRRLPEGAVKLALEEGQLVVFASVGLWKFVSEDPSVYPELVPPANEESVEVEVNSESLKTAISRVLPFIDETSTRYAMGGVYFDFADSCLAATDGRSLGTCPVEFRFGAECPESAVVPAKSLRAVVKEIGDEETAKLTVRRHSLAFELGEVTVYSRLVEGRFPRYQSVIPDSLESSFSLPAAEMVRAIKLATVVASAETRGVGFTFAGNRLYLKTVGADVGASDVSVPLSSQEGELKVTLDPELLVPCLVTSGDVTIHGTDSTVAVKVTDGVATYVVMPMSE